MTTTLIRTRRLTAAVAATVAAAVGVSACSSSGGSGGSKTIKLVAYSVPKPAYDDLAKAFAKTSAGKGVTVQGSYGPSGAQSKAVLAGQKADYVGFSVEPDLTKLVPGKVDKNWNSGPTKGLVSDSVVVIVVRKGNPLHITGWDDLIKPGVKIVTPDPASSGSAKWNILAAYSHVLAQGGTADQARTYLQNFYKHITSRASSGAVATTQFTSGTGNVLISYENEAITARQKGAAVDYLVPDQTIRIENPAAVTKSAPSVAKKFLSFAESTAGQKIFVSHGFRPVVGGVATTGVKGANDPSNPFPTPKKLVTIQSLGGWSVVNDKFFGDNGIVTKIGGSGATLELDKVDAAAAPAGDSRRRRSARRRVRTGLPLSPASGTTLGVIVLWLTILVLLPLAAVVGKAFDFGWSGFWSAISDREATDALVLTLLLSLAVAVIGAVMGTLVAWVLVREPFRGSRVLEMVIDIPFALPTVVAGIVMLAVYGNGGIGPDLFGSRIAMFITLLFVTLPFTVRTVQPVLLQLDRDVEQAAASLGASAPVAFRRIVLPQIVPAVASGSTLAFARAIGEYGSLVFIASALPFKTEVASVLIYGKLQNSDSPERATQQAAAISTVLLLASAVVLVALDLIQRRMARRG